MSDFAILQHWGDETKLEDFGRWMTELYSRLRQARIEETIAAREQTLSDETAPRTQLTAADMISDLVSPEEFRELCRVNTWARERLARVPLASPTFADAAETLAEHSLLRLCQRSAKMILMALYADERLHLPRPDLPKVRIKNLLCENETDTDQILFQAAVFTALYFKFHKDTRETGVITEIIAVFHSVSEIFYNLMASLYPPRRVLTCRKAFATFVRQLGQEDFLNAYRTYLQSRRELDASILAVSATEQASSHTRTQKRGPKGKRLEVSVKYAAKVYQVSAATICAWDQGKGARPLHYPGREVTIDEFNLAAALDLRIKGHKEGVQNRVSAALARGSRK